LSHRSARKLSPPSFGKSDDAVKPPLSSDSKPHQVSLLNRLLCLSLAGLLMAYGITGLLRNKMEISTAKGGGGVVVFAGLPAWLLASALLAAAAGLLSVVVDHYYRTSYEASKRQFKRSAASLALCLLVAAFISNFYMGLAG
jgi:hypothetical protein